MRENSRCVIYLEKVIRKRKHFEEVIFTLNLRDEESSIKGRT